MNGGWWLWDLEPHCPTIFLLAGLSYNGKQYFFPNILTFLVQNSTFFNIWFEPKWPWLLFSMGFSSVQIQDLDKSKILDSLWAHQLWLWISVVLYLHCMFIYFVAPEHVIMITYYWYPCRRASMIFIFCVWFLYKYLR